MTSNAQKIESEFKALPVEDLIALNTCLVQAIYQRDGELPAEDRQELIRRLNTVKDGTAQRVNAFDALAQM